MYKRKESERQNHSFFLTCLEFPLLTPEHSQSPFPFDSSCYIHTLCVYSVWSWEFTVQFLLLLSEYLNCLFNTVVNFNKRVLYFSVFFFFFSFLLFHFYYLSRAFFLRRTEYYGVKDLYHSCPPSTDTKPVEGSGLGGKSGEAVLFSWFRRLKDGIITCWFDQFR